MECLVDLREIYPKEKGNTQLTDKLNDHKICRLCMQLIQGDFMLAHEVEADMLKKYIPEINFDVVKDPVVCKQCFDFLGVHSGFIRKCLEVEEKLITQKPSTISVRNSH
ncbi:uncharacterized protein LOC108914054 [Anoplophora glabripennis]|uniref:uncharacterized protein LOC108914054 n=1 Tax=Anoplophora glabripennis TaxID=217634 RepID=UPI000C76E498|nr:uncharacterized protein LOC108914054 [Anoplophora glabripennis]